MTTSWPASICTDSEWEVAAADQDAVTFRKRLPKLGLEVVKTLSPGAKFPPISWTNPDCPAYHLWLDVKIDNVGQSGHQVAYRLDGPTGLADRRRLVRQQGQPGFDVFGRRPARRHRAASKAASTTQVTPSEIVDAEFKADWVDSPLDYIAVDAQYFAVGGDSAERPGRPTCCSPSVKPTRVGAVPADKTNLKLLDVSFRLGQHDRGHCAGRRSARASLSDFRRSQTPGSACALRSAGTNVTLGDLVYYGWFGFVARPMLADPALLSLRASATTASRSSCSPCWCAAACSRSAASRRWARRRCRSCSRR